MRFGWSDLLRGNRFWAPVSEAALLEAGTAAGLSAGMTLIETACGNGAAAILLAEEFHVYARGVEASGRLVEVARALASRSPAARRVRFFDDWKGGAADALCTLRATADLSLLRSGGPVVWGHYVSDEAAAPQHAPPAGDLVWRREATPLEWERFLAPQERALRRYRRSLKRREQVSRVALEAERRVDRFRSGGLAYELTVRRVASAPTSRSRRARSPKVPHPQEKWARPAAVGSQLTRARPEIRKVHETSRTVLFPE